MFYRIARVLLPATVVAAVLAIGFVAPLEAGAAPAQSGSSVLDLVFANASGANYVCENDGAGGFTCTDVDTSYNYNAVDVGVGDLDGDSDIDLVFANYNLYNRKCLNNGDNTFTCSDITSAGGGGYASAWRGLDVGDVDGDGDLDLVFSANQTNSVCINDGSASFTCAAHGLPTTGVSQNYITPRFGDVNSDGHLDIVIASFENGDTTRNRQCLNDGNSPPTFTCTFLDTGNRTFGLRLGDVDGDGHLDAVFATLDYGKPRLCLGSATGIDDTLCSDIDTVIPHAADAALGDVDGDLDMDIVLVGNGNAGPDHRRVCLNTGSAGSPSFSCTSLPNTIRTDGAALGDLDGDLDLDLAVAEYDNGVNQVCENDGSGALTCSDLTGTSLNSSAVAIADVVGAPPKLAPTTEPGEDLFCVDETTTVSIDISDVEDLYGYMLKVNYDETLVSVDDAWFETSFFNPAGPGTGGSTPPTWNAVCASGTCQFAKSMLFGDTAATGSGTLAKITFKGLVAGTFDVTISDNVLSDIDGYTIDHDIAPLPLTVCGWAKASGTVSLQGRATPKGTAPSDPPGEVTAYDGFFALSTAPYSGAIDPDTGDWLIENIRVMPGGTEYTFDAAHGLYLGNQTTHTLSPLDDWDAGPTRLLGGDANNDGTDDISDLACIGGDFGGTPSDCGGTGSSDINWDATTNIQDLAIAGGNYTKTTHQPW
jgi:hypothetical protein